MLESVYKKHTCYHCMDFCHRLLFRSIFNLGTTSLWYLFILVLKRRITRCDQSLALEKYIICSLQVLALRSISGFKTVEEFCLLSVGRVVVKSRLFDRENDRAFAKHVYLIEYSLLSILDLLASR